MLKFQHHRFRCLLQRVHEVVTMAVNAPVKFFQNFFPRGLELEGGWAQWLWQEQEPKKEMQKVAR